MADYEFNTDYLLNHLFHGALGSLNLQPSKVSEDIFELSSRLNIKLEDIVLELKHNTKQIVGKLKPDAHDKVMNYRINQLLKSQLSITNTSIVEASNRFNIEHGRFQKNFHGVDILGQGAFGKVI